MVTSLNIQGTQNLQTNLGNAVNKVSIDGQKIASGKKYIYMYENPADQVVGTALVGQVKILNSVLNSANQAVSILNIADAAIANIISIQQRQQEIVSLAISGAIQDAQRALLNQEFQQLSSEINRIAINANFNGRNLLNGDASPTHGTPLQFQVDISATQILTVGIESFTSSKLLADANDQSKNVSDIFAQINALSTQSSATNPAINAQIVAARNAVVNLVNTNIGNNTSAVNLAENMRQNYNLLTQQGGLFDPTGSNGSLINAITNLSNLCQNGVDQNMFLSANALLPALYTFAGNMTSGNSVTGILGILNNGTGAANYGNANALVTALKEAAGAGGILGAGGTSTSTAVTRIGAVLVSGVLTQTSNLQANLAVLTAPGAALDPNAPASLTSTSVYGVIRGIAAATPAAGNAADNAAVQGAQMLLNNPNSLLNALTGVIQNAFANNYGVYNEAGNDASGYALALDAAITNLAAASAAGGSNVTAAFNTAIEGILAGGFGSLTPAQVYARYSNISGNLTAINTDLAAQATAGSIANLIGAAVAAAATAPGDAAILTQLMNTAAIYQNLLLTVQAATAGSYQPDALTISNRFVYTYDTMTVNSIVGANIAGAGVQAMLDQYTQVQRTAVAATQSRFTKVIDYLSSSIQNIDAARAQFLDGDLSVLSQALAQDTATVQASISALAKLNQLPQILLGLINNI